VSEPISGERRLRALSTDALALELDTWSSRAKRWRNQLTWIEGDRNSDDERALLAAASREAERRVGELAGEFSRRLDTCERVAVSRS
jgi:hypothetical protein